MTKPPPPAFPANFTRAQYLEYSSSLTLEELLIAAHAFAQELKAREGKLKFTPDLPAHLVN